VKNTLKLLLLGLVVALSILACGEATPQPTPIPTPTTNPNLPPRGYHLGFTPFPYDTSTEAVDFTYERIALNADIIAHHFDDGIPWPEALSGDTYPNRILQDWEAARSRTPEGHKIYIAITPINLMRDGMALYRGEEGEEPLPEPWSSYDFDHPDVKEAFLNHARFAVEFFQPDYLAIGIEVDLLLDKVPDQWDAFMELHKFVYTELKREYPDLPIFASVFGIAMLEGYVDGIDTMAHLQTLEELLPYSDYYAISLYPFLSKYMTDSVPEDMFEKLFSLSDKPIAITETAYPAQTFTLEEAGVTFESDEQKQLAYFSGLLEEADRRDFVFIIDFFLRDYDAFWEKVGKFDLATFWRDTGFYDEDGYPRPVLDLWMEALVRPYQ
jgi:hypothetical protein